MSMEEKEEDLGSLIRHMHWLLKQINQYQAARQYDKALHETNALEDVIWKVQQKLRSL